MEGRNGHERVIKITKIGAIVTILLTSSGVHNLGFGVDVDESLIGGIEKESGNTIEDEGSGVELDTLDSGKLEEVNLEEVNLEEENLEGDALEELTLEDEGQYSPMLFSVMSAPVNNYVMATDSDFSGTSNGSFRYIGSHEYVEIPHQIKGVNVTSYADMFRRTEVKGVKSTNKNVTNMGNMFYDLQSEELDVIQLDTTNVTNMAGMFSARSDEIADSKLTTLDLSNFYTGKVQSMNSMFLNSSIKELDLSSFDTSNVTNMSTMFRKTSADFLDLSSFDTSKVTSMSYMFMDTKARGVDISSFDTSRVTSMEYMFGATWKGWNNIRTLDVRHFDTSNVTHMGAMFRGSLVKELDLSNFNTSKVYAMNAMFENSDIVNLDLRSFDTSRVIVINAMFRNATAKTVNVSSFDTSRATNMNDMFADTNIDTVDVSSFDTSNVQYMAAMFRDSNFIEINLGNFNTRNVTNMRDMFRGSKARKIDVSSFDTSKVTTMSFMFERAMAEELDLSHFDTGRVSNMSYMFTDSNAKVLNVSNFDTRNVTDMKDMFKGSKASELDLSSFNTQRITSMSNMFRDSQATKINLNNFETTYVLDMSNMFMNAKVSEIDIRSFDMSSVNLLDNMFSGAVARTGIARTQEDVNKLSQSTGIPTSGLTFVPFYQIATDEDFTGFYNGNFRYVGTKEYVEIPKTIRGTALTSYESLFENTSVKGVISNNKNIVNMANMFRGNTSTVLNVGSIDTTNVTNMSGMFQDTKANVLDLKGFDTAKVVNTSNMFRNTAVNELDLGSFDLSKATNTASMFQDTQARVGYARTKEDLGKLNGSTNKPTTLSLSIWGILTDQSPSNWTNGNVEIEVNANSDLRSISYVEMINEPGRNLLRNTHRGNTSDTFQGLGITRAVRTVESGYTDTYSIRTINPPMGGTYTLSFYARSSKPTSFVTHFYDPNTTTHGINSQGRVNTARDGNSAFVSSTEWQRYWVTYTQTPSSTNKAIIVGRIRGISDIEIAGVKLEEGDTASPWTPAPEDSNSGEQQNTYTVFENGTYVFRATDTEGNTKNVSHTVSNIDRDKPTIEVTPSTTGWTSQDVTLYVNADDALSGVKDITLPNGTKVPSKSAEFVVKENGSYTYTVTDNAGNTETVTTKVTNIDRSRPSLNATVSNKDWTRNPINIEVTSGDSSSGLSGITLVNSPMKGRNLSSKLNEEVGNIEYGVNVTEGASSFRGFVRTKGYIPVEGNTEYTITVHNDWKVSGSVWQYGSDKEVVSDVNEWVNGVNTLTFKTLPDAKFIRYRFRDTESFSQNLLIHPLEDWRVKVELGKESTPWTPAHEDIVIVDNGKTYPVIANGMYTFEAVYNNGATSEVSVNVTNIDLEKPTVNILNNPEDWTEDDEVVLEIHAKDDLSGVKSITLPDGRIVIGDKATYTVTENGEYTFIVEDNVGNITTHTETVDRLMMKYGFYIYDSNGRPINGARFALLRNGDIFKEAMSDSSGYVDFGKVPSTWNYTIRQLSSPDGGHIIPGDIDVDDPTDPVEVVTYPRGKELPSTGTLDKLITLALVSGVITALYVVKRKKKELK